MKKHKNLIRQVMVNEHCGFELYFKEKGKNSYFELRKFEVRRGRDGAEHPENRAWIYIPATIAGKLFKDLPSLVSVAQELAKMPSLDDYD
jgi:hypothetical protein